MKTDGASRVHTFKNFMPDLFIRRNRKGKFRATTNKDGALRQQRDRGQAAVKRCALAVSYSRDIRRKWIRIHRSYKNRMRPNRRVSNTPIGSRTKCGPLSRLKEESSRLVPSHPAGMTPGVGAKGGSFGLTVLTLCPTLFNNN
jgi:hypothetical protein